MEAKVFFRNVKRFCVALCRLLRKVSLFTVRWAKFLWIHFWRSAIILTAKFFSGASVSWVEDSVYGSAAGGKTGRWGRGPFEPCQRIYFANHSSHLDAIVIWTSLPESIRRETRMVAAFDYWNAGPLRRFLSKKVFNAILIDRKHVSIRNNPINQLLKEMGTEYSIIIFPEGGRGNGERLQSFKSGIYYLAKKKPEVELIPVYLDNMNRILPRGMVLPVPMLSRVIFGSPIWIEEGEMKEAFLNRCREALLKLKDSYSSTCT